MISKIFKKFHKSTKVIPKGNRAFTLIEMIVALGIFTLVAVVAVGAFVKIIDANKKSQSIKTAVNNLNFALESMTREMRVGYDFYCNPPTSTISRSYTPTSCIEQEMVAFRSSKKGTGTTIPTCNLIHAYRYNGALRTLEKAEQSNCDENITSGGGLFLPVVSKELDVESLKFTVSLSRNVGPTGGRGGSSVAGRQAWIRAVMRANAGDRVSDKVSFTLETFISPRVIR
jgi:prepilin-type N-terminal cleavage/methylation domain-containing protein